MPTLKGTESSVSYVQCFLYLVFSSINVPIFHITWLDIFWTHYVCVCVYTYTHKHIYIYIYKFACRILKTFCIRGLCLSSIIFSWYISMYSLYYHYQFILAGCLIGRKCYISIKSVLAQKVTRYFDYFLIILYHKLFNSSAFNI